MLDRKAPREKVKLDPASEAWTKLPWRKLEQHVFRIQKRIYQASQRGNQRAVQKLQKLLMKSEAARLLAVRRVTQDNQGKKTAGIDGVKSVHAKRRRVMATQIHPRQWKHQKPQPVRRIYIPKPGKVEKRPLGIPIMKDRAQQALVKLALEPEWEARFEPNSYGFRPGRSCHDAIMAIWSDIRLKDKYVLDADLKGCFDNIDHEALLQKLQTFPAIKRIIKAWLQAGMIENGVFATTPSGTPQGGVISPLLANIALHGMEMRVHQAFSSIKDRAQFVRYADDFVVFHPTLEGVLKAKEALETWLKEMGLELKPSKTKITHTLEMYQGNVGFDFLGWNVRQYPVGKTHTGTNMHGTPLGFKTIIRPSKEKVQIHMQEVKRIIDENVAKSQEMLINQLNPVIWGWTNYYKTMVAAEEFSQCDHHMWWQLWRWAKRRHPNKGQGWKKERYWQTDEDRQWIFSTPDGTKLRQHSKTKIQRHAKVKGTASPYDGNVLYWSQRTKNGPMLRTDKGILLRKQQGKCKWCELLITDEETIVIDYIEPLSQGGKNRIDNKWLVHRHCREQRRAKRAEHERKLKEMRSKTGVNHK